MSTEDIDLPTEVLIGNSTTPLGKIYLDWKPQPGNYLEIDGQAYTVLERRHNYQFRRGRYRLSKIVISVQTAQKDPERTYLEGRWIIGDASCIYNAKSEVLRCAVNPAGPCQGCSLREVAPEIEAEN
ncbi:hypothetical protein Pse7367_1230 [Thalassoporum mexicanum PCC 7367]|uniref:DUF6464 family protein n=1 Tax=Thalassoporum mexicanum TaxID=3457544 RepID=UPI00029FA457|nr:DUF6464 family protein [Pseudanabaena sp. PCC 7367]AFY69525.1 hypothetical protein Pse7367_1230 [Pseudanabaena sp. PCC 7367]